MEPIYVDEFEISDLQCDRFGRLRGASILWLVQEMAGRHCKILGVDWDTLAAKGMFWAIIRHQVQVTRLPQKGQTIRIETWPMPTSRVAYPRQVVAYDQDGTELFRTVSVWVLMDLHSRAMILPGKSGVEVCGVLRGGELPTPKSVSPAGQTHSQERTVRFTDLDLNGHMNNCRYLDWAYDLLPSDFHRSHTLAGFSLGYLSEAIEGDQLKLSYDLEAGDLQLQIQRLEGDGAAKIFCAQIHYDTVIL